MATREARSRVWIATGLVGITKAVVTQKIAGTQPQAQQMSHDWARENDLILIGVTEILHPRMEALLTLAERTVKAIKDGKVAMLIASVVVVLFAAGCGGSGDPAMRAALQSMDQVSVLHAVLAIENDSINGGNLLLDSQQLAVRIRHAKGDGIDSAWLSGQIDDSQQALAGANCPACYSILEDVRP